MFSPTPSGSRVTPQRQGSFFDSGCIIDETTVKKKIHKMELEKTDYMVGLSPMIRDNVKPSRVCALVKRAIDGDPGDAENIEAIMHTISTHMSGGNSCHFFAPEELFDEPVMLMLKQKEKRVLLFSLHEMGRPEMQHVMEAFGFDGETLEPLYED
jgi:hypothetical protein